MTRTTRVPAASPRSRSNATRCCARTVEQTVRGCANQRARRRERDASATAQKPGGSPDKSPPANTGNIELGAPHNGQAPRKWVPHPELSRFLTSSTQIDTV
jgi:hypothetical protein